jgi:hypothetical protein
MVDKDTKQARDVELTEETRPKTAAFLADSKRSILKSTLRTYEADPVRLTPGLDTSNISLSPLSELVFNNTNPRIRFASTDSAFQVKNFVLNNNLFLLGI